MIHCTLNITYRRRMTFMISNQKFIEIGPGYTDVYELFEIMKTNQHRLFQTFILQHDTKDDRYFSFAAAFRPIGESKFLPIYICREGIVEKTTQEKPSKRRDMFIQLCEELEQTPVILEVKPSNEFADVDLFYQYVIGILRMNRLLPNLY